ncbi:hypothetical protein B0H12DRAFT_733149 [Mycena haematopus]|nr:hypothetical protein B0H12DRAFT_733149 [Mycena haematopus]
MPSRRTDAAHIAPYLTHHISHHGQLTLIPPDNNGRRRKQSRSRRNSPREEPVRFSSGGEVSLGRPPHVTRPSRTEGRYNDLLEDIPDYPPPSFLEAMSSPPVSVCPSTTTLGRFTTPISHHADSDSESDEASLDIIDSGSTVERSPVHSQTPPRGRGILDSDPDDSARAPSSSTRSHRRHLSLSPLRTLFPSRNPRDSGHALSAQSTPSAHSLAFSRTSPFFRSTTSLRNLTSSAPLSPPSPSSAPSLRSESFLGPRRLFSHKGKERATSEALDSWEIVESELPAAPTTPTPPKAPSPVIDVSSANLPPTALVSPTPAPIHPLSERDRRAKGQIYIPPARVREPRVPPPPPPAPVPFAPGEGPPIVTVRMKKIPPPPPPKKKPRPMSSPLRGTDRLYELPELDLDRAIRTPLPLTPVTSSPTSPFALSTEPGSAVQERADSIILSPTPRSSSGTSENADVNAVDGEGHYSYHYPGRPLPRRPRVPVDSTYAPHPDFPQVEVQHEPPSVPEGLLIDLDGAETPTVHTRAPSLLLQFQQIWIR